LVDLERWLPKGIDAFEQSPQVRDCCLTQLKFYPRRFLNAHFEIVTAPHLSPLAPPTQLLHAAYSRTGQFSPGWTARQFDQAYLKYLMESPRAQRRIQALQSIARHKIVFLVGLHPDPSVCGRKLLRNLILEGMK
jgi:hypothetical protein